MFREALSCKQEAELGVMFQHKAKWSCHFDDDSFVNYENLRKVLASYDESKLKYLGRKSTQHPVSIETDGAKRKFYFGTGGAGWCVSRPLLLQMERILMEKSFTSISSSIGLPDDVTIGFIIDQVVGVELNNETKFNSHLNHLASIDPQRQVRLFYISRNSLSLGKFTQDTKI